MNFNLVLNVFRNKLINKDDMTVMAVYRMLLSPKCRKDFSLIPENFWTDVINNGIIVRESDSTFDSEYISYTYEAYYSKTVPSIIHYRNFEKEDNIDMILNVLLNKDVLIDFLGYNESNIIIDKILCDDVLLNQLRNIPESFWIDAMEGLLLYSEYTVTKNKQFFNLDYKYQYFHDSKKNVPALVYQKKKDYK